MILFIQLTQHYKHFTLYIFMTYTFFSVLISVFSEFVNKWAELDKKWNESDFRPLLCTYRLNWARRTSWGWWDEWDDTALQTQDSKFKPWMFEAKHATSRSRRLPRILSFTSGWRGEHFCIFPTAATGKRTPNSSVKGSGANQYPKATEAVNYLKRLYRLIT